MKGFSFERERLTAWTAGAALLAASLFGGVVLVHYRFGAKPIGSIGFTFLGHAFFLTLVAFALLYARQTNRGRLSEARRFVAAVIVTAAVIAFVLAATATLGVSPMFLPSVFAWTVIGIVLLLPPVVAINVAVFCALFAVVECSYRLVERARDTDPAWVEGGQYFVGDPVLGYRGEARAARYRALDMMQSDTIYDVEYGLTSDGWRFVPDVDSLKANSFIAFFGDSFTWGEGVADSATLPAWVSRIGYERARTYDLGFHGWGPQEMLALMESPAIPLGIKERSGIAIFTTIDAHMARLVGDYSVTSRWGYRMPYYVRAADGSLQRHGDFTTGRPLLQAFFQIVAGSHVLERFIGRSLSRFTPPDWPLMADVLKRSCDLFATRYQSEGCYVVIWPGELESHRELPARLAARGVRVLDYALLWPHTDSALYEIRMDNHPNAFGYRTVANQLVHDLERDRMTTDARR